MNIYKPDKIGNATGIQYTKAPGTVAGATWNPTGGCFHNCSWVMDGAVIGCYAKAIADRFRSDKVYQHGFQHAYWHPGRLDEPKRKKQPHGIFIGSMADLYGQWVKEDRIHEVLNVCNETPQHTYFSLTKNPRRLLDFNHPENEWVGCSLPGGPRRRKRDPEMVMMNTLRYLYDVRAVVRWVSLEPLWFDVAGVLRRWIEEGSSLPFDWMVIGAGSNGNRVYQPKPEWVDGLLDVAGRCDIPIFMKKNLDWPERVMAFPEV